MHEHGFFFSIHRILWLAVTLLTGILAGFLVSHSVMLGRYFTWLIETGHYEVFTDIFSDFRRATRANVHYNLFLWVHLALGILWLPSCFIVRSKRAIALTAGLSSFWVGSVFFASGFAAAEQAVATGMADDATQTFFVSWNLPLHASFAAFYTLCFLLLLLSGTARRGK